MVPELVADTDPVLVDPAIWPDEALDDDNPPADTASVMNKLLVNYQRSSKCIRRPSLLGSCGLASAALTTNRSTRICFDNYNQKVTLLIHHQC